MIGAVEAILVIPAVAIPVLALIPAMVNDSERHDQRRRRLLYYGAAAATLLLSAALTVAAWKSNVFFPLG